MKTIVINEHDNISTDIVEEICNIDLTQDVVISMPMWRAGRKKDIDVDIDMFTLRNYTDLKPGEDRTYTFFPRMKMTLPKGLIPNFNTKIHGLQISEISTTKVEGVEVNHVFDVPEKQIDISAIHGTYTIYTKFVFQMKEYHRSIFSRNKFVGFRIPMDTDIINMYLTAHFFGIGTFKPESYREIYLIYNDKTYQSLPDL